MHHIMHETIDPEHDEYVDVVVMPDYNGESLATVFMTGVPILTIDAGNDYQYNLIIPNETYARQAYVEFLWQIQDGGSEFTHEAFINAVGSDAEEQAFVDFLEEGDGHELIAFVGRVAHKMHENDPGECPEPTGF